MLASIDKYFTKHQEDAFPVLQSVVHLILREAVGNTIAGDPIDKDVLHIAIRDLYAMLERVPSAGEQGKIAQAAFEAFRIYNRETARFVHSHVQECSKSLQVVRELLAMDLSVSDMRASLEKVADQLSKAVEGPPKKPRPIALDAHVAEAPAETIPPPQEIVPAEPSSMEIDEITGLPQRGEAEICVAGFIREGRKAYMLAVIIDQMSMIDKRYGAEVKENVLMFFSQLLQQTKQERDMLFRWNDRCFLLLMNRTTEKHYIRDEALTMLNSRYRSNAHIGGRPVMLNVGACHKLWHVSEFNAAGKFGEALDQYLLAVAR